MHELSIAVGIVEAVVEEAELRGIARVAAVHVRLGALAGVDRDALLFSFPIACEGTAAEGAELTVEDVPVFIACDACAVETEAPSMQQMSCPRCGGISTRVVQGRELELRGFEVAEEART